VGAHPLFGPLRIACEEGVEDGAVLGQGLLQPAFGNSE